MNTLKDLQSLSDRFVLITGAAGKLGKVFAETLAELGASLILVDRTGASTKNLAGELKSRWNINVFCFECDLENVESRICLINAVRNEIGQLNCLINNAAFGGMTNLSGWVCKFEDQSLDSWRRAIEVNLTSAFHLAQELSSLLKLSEGGNIINVASIYGEYGPDWRLYEGTQMGNPAAYSASKGGLIQLTRWLATTLSPKVRVNAISPGGILRGQDELFIDRYTSRTPLQRMASEEDFRGVISFLATDMSSYVTGQIIAVDGGWGVW